MPINIRFKQKDIDSFKVYVISNYEFFLSIDGFYCVFCKTSKKRFEFSSYKAARAFLSNLLKGN